jgi:hypothetical protein
MPTALPQPFEVSPGPVLQAMRLGQSDRLAEEQRGALKAAGQFAAKGQLGQARNYLYGQGMLDEGAKIDHMIRQADADTLAKTQRSHTVLGNLALAADTPEKWAMAVDTAAKAGIDTSKWRDFGSRDVLLAQSGMVGQKLEMELQRRQMQMKDEAIKRDIENTAYERSRQGRLDTSTEARANRALDLQERSLTAKETLAPYVFSKEGIGNKYTGEFKSFPSNINTQSGELDKGFRWRMKGGQPDLDASGRPIAEPIPGSKGEQVSAEVAARVGLADKFAEDAPKLRKEIESGKLSGSDYYLGRGEAGAIYRRIEDGAEALVRNLTGAGMNQTEAEAYAKRFLPGNFDTQATVLEKLRNLEENLTAVRRRVMTGRGVTAGDAPAPGAAPQTAPGAADDPLGILGN